MNKPERDTFAHIQSLTTRWWGAIILISVTLISQTFGARVFDVVILNFAYHVATLGAALVVSYGAIYAILAVARRMANRISEAVFLTTVMLACIATILGAAYGKVQFDRFLTALH